MNQTGTEELALAEATETPGGSVPESGATNKPVVEPPQIFTFADMKLGVGDRLQIQLPAHLQSERAFVKVVGYLENTSLIVTAPSRHGVRLELLENEVLIVRAFSRQSAFAFNCSILRVCKLPFDYLHLSFPRRIQGTVIRKSTRVRAGFDAELGVAAPAGTSTTRATIVNVSSTGALVSAHESLGAAGDILTLRFRVHLHDVDSELEVAATILNTAQEDGTDTECGCVYRHGIEFQNLRPNDRMIITSFVYQQIIENPHSVV